MRVEEDNREAVDDGLANDENWLAYQEALKADQFKGLEPGAYVAFHEGKQVGIGMDRDVLFKELFEKGITGFFYHQVGVPERVVHLGGAGLHIVRLAAPSVVE